MYSTPSVPLPQMLENSREALRNEKNAAIYICVHIYIYIYIYIYI